MLPLDAVFRLGAKTLLLWLVLTTSCSSAAAAATVPAAGIKTIFQFPNNTWIENLAVRENGQLLVTHLSPPALYLVDPATYTARLVHKFDDGITVVTGLTEYEPDVFAVAGGVANPTALTGTKDTWHIYSVDLRQFPSSAAVISKAASVPSAEFLNGVTPYNSSIVFASESFEGLIYQIDLRTGESRVAIDRPILKKISGGPNGFGVNGLQYGFDKLFFTNSAQNVVGYFELERIGGERSSGDKFGNWTDAHILARDTNADPGYFDDFAIIGLDGHFQKGYFVRGSADTVDLITASGRQSTVAGQPSSNAIEGPTSVKLGRGLAENILYVTTNGGLGGTVDHLQTTGGQLVAVDLSQWSW